MLKVCYKVNLECLVLLLNINNIDYNFNVEVYCYVSDWSEVCLEWGLVWNVEFIIGKC